MGSTPYVLQTQRPFRPRYVTPTELPLYGLPDATKQPNILALVDAASTFIDEYCGRTDGNGQGSLVYSTYQERILLQSPGRNIFRVTFKPLAVITPTMINELSASGNKVQDSNNPLMNVNSYYTGAQPNTVVVPTTAVSPILSASGRYGYPRRGEAAIYPDLAYGMNPMQVAAYFGGPPSWTGIDASMIDFDTATGEIWVPAGLYMSRYTEIVITYNSGYNPNRMPQAIKQACIGLIKNFLARGGGVYAMKSINTAGAVNYTFTDDMVDKTVERFLDAYRVVMAY